MFKIAKEEYILIVKSIPSIIKITLSKTLNIISSLLYPKSFTISLNSFLICFFLVTALTQLVEILRVGLFITFIGPLIMVLGLTMAKEAYDDYRTYLRDIEVII